MWVEVKVNLKVVMMADWLVEWWAGLLESVMADLLVVQWVDEMVSLLVAKKV